MAAMGDDNDVKHIIKRQFKEVRVYIEGNSLLD
jgi:hypothetical protein